MNPTDTPERPHERFARAVDGLAHEVPDGAERDDFAAELAVVHELRKLGSSANPDEVTRERMRHRLLRSLPAQPGPAESGPHAPGSPGRRSRRHGRRSAPARFLVAAAAVACLLLALSGLSLMLARDALPGDSLYQFKQLGERASLGLTLDEQGKARKHLEFAANRLSELHALAGAGADRPEYYKAALDGLDADAADGARRLIQLGISPNDKVSLTELQQWVGLENSQLRGLHAQLPAAVQPQASRTARMLERIAERAAELRERLHCEQITSGAVDEIGLLPSHKHCAPLPSPPASGPDARKPQRPPNSPGQEQGSSAEANEQSAVRPPSRPQSQTAAPGPGPATQDPRPAQREPGERPNIPLPPVGGESPIKPQLPPMDLPPLLPGLPGILFR